MSGSLSAPACGPACKRVSVAGGVLVFLLALGVTLSLQKGAKAQEPPAKADQAPAAAELAPPDFLDRWYAYLEWLLEIQPTESQQQECRQVWMQRWQEIDQPMRDRFRAYANAELTWWSETGKQNEDERAELRAEKRLFFLSRMGNATDRDERLLLHLYKVAHQPGGERNPILVAGKPPLTLDMVDQGRRWIQWLLDIRLTAPQRLKYQRLFVENWKTWDKGVKDAYVKSDAQDALNRLPQMSPYSRDLLRAERQSQLMAVLQQSSDDGLAQMFLSIRESVHRPGGERNPVLVAGATPLTQDMVNQFGDFVEWGLDLKDGRGLTAPRREALRDLLKNCWEKGTDTWKTALVKQLQDWQQLLRLSAPDRAKVYAKVHPELLAHLRRTVSPLNRWLLEVWGAKENENK
jgi:hypothetical protein